MQQNICPSCKAVLGIRLEIEGSLVQFSAERYFPLVTIPHSSAEPMQMKSSMTIYL